MDGGIDLVCYCLVEYYIHPIVQLFPIFNFHHLFLCLICYPFVVFTLCQRYSEHFGWQLQERLQNLLRKEYFGELPVGQAAIIETFENDLPEVEREWMKDKNANEGKLIHFLISSPTNRVPGDVHETVNAYLAFRAVLLAGELVFFILL